MKQEYHLYRAKFIKPAQSSFLHDADTTPTLLLLQSLTEKPSAEFRESFVWHIGNLTGIENEATAGYFAIGRITTATIPKFDPLSGNFGDKEDDTSPYTFVVYDAKIGLMAIRKKSALAPTTQDIAYKIEKLLSQTSAIIKNEVEVLIQLIPNPDSFLEMVDRAYAVKSFTASFTGPNPFDADEFFQKPLSVYLNSANGESGEATIIGANLSKDVVSAVARSTASTGNGASAQIQEEEGKRPFTIYLTNNPVKLVYEDEEISPKQVLADARKAYERVRHERD